MTLQTLILALVPANDEMNVYERAAWASYENCLDLLDDANILVERSKFPRAYALTILAAEEFCKSYLYKCLSAGLTGKGKIKKIVPYHDEKIFRFIHLMVNPTTMAIHHSEIEEAMTHDKDEPDHSKHLYLEVMKRVHLESLGIVRWLTSTFKHAEILKLRALYVDLRRGNVLVPKDAVQVATVKKVHKFVANMVDGFDVILDEDHETFRKVAESIDPGLSYVLGPTEPRQKKNYHQS